MFSLAQFFNQLDLLPMRWDIRRNDETSGTGGGTIITAELADPLWTAEIKFRRMRSTRAEQMAALVRKLRGSQETFLFSNPFICGPQADPDGTILGASTVTVAAVGSDYTTISLEGLPTSYKITLGDKIQIVYGDSPVRYAFLEASANKTASGAGVSGSFAVFPNVPVGVAEGDAVTLVNPAARCIMVPGSHNVGTASGSVTDGQSFQIIQKKI
ncbi:hypothetical protein HGO38_01530 [Rhizobium sp. CG5]|uniref:hypothetical protein n=1 Tax=Rhizobium sp. CG5 TaxID=2726076 RepID=UPI002033F940|nr:hypothetical protein [Rhizobium sp. CG5]MCM2472157.1 hypothetical protein [Rhizobium sp. CG5]